MKRSVAIFFVLCVVFSLAFVNCSKKKDEQPCDNKGMLCLENKMDTTVTIFITPVRIQFDLQLDYIKCTELGGNQPYTITVSKPDFSWDTTLIVLPCDNKLMVIKTK
jgi:hypothetical protein